MTASARFTAAGGADGGRHGDSFVFRSPTKSGAYVLGWGEAKAFDLLVLTAARMTCTKTTAGQKTTVTLGRSTVGSYPDPTSSKSKRVRDNPASFIPPLWYFRFDSKTEAIHLSPSVTVGHMVGFIGRGPATRKGRRHVTYFPPSRALVRKLEAVVTILEKKGVPARRGLVLTSGFRTPRYNAKIGGSGFSRHAFGDGADVIIDASPVDGRMDDLNKDGRIDRLDGKMVADAAREAELSGNAVPGGIGLYEYVDPKSVLCHVHIDARGYITRWGTTYKTGKALKFRWWPEWEFPEEDDDE